MAEKIEKLKLDGFFVRTKKCSNLHLFESDKQPVHCVRLSEVPTKGTRHWEHSTGICFIVLSLFTDVISTVGHFFSIKVSFRDNN